MRPEVTVHGAGLAGLTCALQLARGGCRVTLAGAASARTPMDLVLNEPTLTVLTGVWGAEVRAEGHALTSRCVRWGLGAVELDVPAPAVVMDGARLAEVLEHRLLRAAPDRVRRTERAEVPEPGQWAIHATAPGDSCPPVGRRCALVAHAPLAGGAPPAVSHLRTTADGWVYLAPLGDGRALIQAMTPAPPPDPVRHLTALLADSGQHQWLGGAPERVSVVPAAPWIGSRGAEPGRISIGGGVLRLDPVSGSGAGHALRTAVLAAAVVRGINDGLPAGTVLDHYTQRIRAAFRDHLAACLMYYRTAFDTAPWRAELATTTAALAAAGAGSHQFRLTLHGDQLRP